MKKRNPVISGVIYAVLTVVVLIMLLPFFWVLFGSLKTQGEFFANPGAWLPESFNTSNYVTLFDERGFGTYLRNSAIIAVVTVISNVICASMAGYAAAKLKFPGKKLIIPFVVVAMTMPYVALFVSSFVIVVKMGLANTLIAIMMPMLVLPICVFIMHQFALTFPDELLEAGRLDGASEFRLFTRVFLPLSGPALATVAIFSFLQAWNTFLWPLIVAQSQSKFTLSVGLAVASQASNTLDFGILLAGAVVVLAPVLVLFLTLQRYFIQGIATTGLK